MEIGPGKKCTKEELDKKYARVNERDEQERDSRRCSRRKVSFRIVNGARHVSTDAMKKDEKIAERKKRQIDKLRQNNRLKQSCKQSKTRGLRIRVRLAEPVTNERVTSLFMSASR
jgi:hypothetical protein